MLLLFSAQVFKPFASCLLYYFIYTSIQSILTLPFELDDGWMTRNIWFVQAISCKPVIYFTDHKNVNFWPWEITHSNREDLNCTAINLWKVHMYNAPLCAQDPYEESFL